MGLLLAPFCIVQGKQLDACVLDVPSVAPSPSRGILDLSTGWRYSEVDSPLFYKPGVDDHNWQRTGLPARILRRNSKGHFWLRKRFRYHGATGSRLGLFLGAHAGKAWVWLNGHKLTSRPSDGPPLFFVDPPVKVGVNHIALRIKYGRWHGGLKWRGKPRLGPVSRRRRGFFKCRFTSSADATEQPYGLYLPESYSGRRSHPLIVALHGMNGDIYSFIYSNLLDHAEKEGYIVIFPHARGNSLYIRKAENDVTDAMDHVAGYLSIDQRRISLLGFSMGGTGALSTAYHHPHRFAATVSIMGDSLYHKSLGRLYRYYYRRFFKNRAEEKRYSVLHFAANALHLPVYMFQGKNDRVSPARQLTLLKKKVRKLSRERGIHFVSKFEHVPGFDHEEELMQVKMQAIFNFIRNKKSPECPDRVIFKSSSNGYQRNRRGELKKGEYNRVYWLGFRIKRVGHFGEAEVVKNSCTNRIEIRVLKNVSVLLLDLPAMRLKPARPITLVNPLWKKVRIRLEPGTIRTPALTSWWGPVARYKKGILILQPRSAVRISFNK